MINPVLFEQIKAFVLSYSSYYDSSEITYLTTMESDLGITGVDAYGFMDNFFREFAIDPSTFQFDKYFRPEGFSRKTITYDLLIEDLIEAMCQKKWINPVIQSPI